MGLEKLIGKQVVQMIKDSDRVSSSVLQMKDKLLKESLTVLKNAGIDPAALPFDPIAVLNGDFPNPDSLLNSDTICSVPPIAPNKIQAANNAIQKAQGAFSAVIENTNKLKSALIDIQAPLGTISTTGESAAGIVDSISNVIKIIKAIPIPTAFGAPAVALPVKVLTILSSTLIRLDKIVVIGKGTVSFVAPMVKSVSGVLNQTISAVGTLEKSLEPALTMLSLVKSVLELSDQCPNIPTEDIQAVKDETIGDLNEALLASGDSSLLDVNIDNELELLNSFPFEYNGFLLEIENNPDNSYPFPSRRIKATRDFEANPDENTGSIFVRTKFNTPLAVIILFNDPGGLDRFSYSTSLSVLVKEMKFKIDFYLKGVKMLALPTVTEAETGGGKVRGAGATNTNQQIAPPGSTGRPVGSGPLIDLDPGTAGGSDDPPSPTGSVDPPQPPAYYFSNPNAFTEATPTRLTVSGSFVVTRPVKIKMKTFGGTNPLNGESTAFLRIYKQGIPGYSFMMEQQYADTDELVTTQNNPQGYYLSNSYTPAIPAPEYWPINPGFANGTVANNLGIFQYVLELTDYIGQPNGADGNSAQFEIEAQ